jgi:hypothetical protein
MSKVDELEREQLRLSLLALHRRVLFFGPRRNFFMLFAFLSAATGAAIYLLPSDSFLYLFPVIFIVPPFALHHSYFIELPATKSVLAFFEHNHPELCSWLPESALLEAEMLYEQKGH